MKRTKNKEEPTPKRTVPLREDNPVPLCRGNVLSSNRRLSYPMMFRLNDPFPKDDRTLARRGYSVKQIRKKSEGHPAVARPAMGGRNSSNPGEDFY